jgi:hypothetical protein
MRCLLQLLFTSAIAIWSSSTSRAYCHTDAATMKKACAAQFNALENATFFAEAKGGHGCQAQATVQAGGGLVPEPQGKVNFPSLLDASSEYGFASALQQWQTPGSELASRMLAAAGDRSCMFSML